MKILKLNKQTITTLSSNDMGQINGGGAARSNRLQAEGKDCKFSKNNVSYTQNSGCQK